MLLVYTIYILLMLLLSLALSPRMREGGQLAHHNQLFGLMELDSSGRQSIQRKETLILNLRSLADISKTRERLWNSMQLEKPVWSPESGWLATLIFSGNTYNQAVPKCNVMYPSGSCRYGQEGGGMQSGQHRASIHHRPSLCPGAITSVSPSKDGNLTKQHTTFISRHKQMHT